MRTIRDWLPAAAILLLPGIGLAAEPGAGDPGPLSFELSLEVQNDHVYRSDDPDRRRNDLYATIEPTFTLRPLPGLSFVLHGVLEPARDPEPGENRAFEDEGLYVQDLYAAYERGPYGVMAGKFTPNFGIAWDLAPGIYGTDFAEDYELSERVGLGASVEAEAGAAGTLTFSGSAFRSDTSSLSRSAFTDRGRLRHDDGGPSNADGLSSFALALDGADVPALPGLAWRLAFVRQAAGKGDASDERGFSAGLTYAVPVGEVAVAPIAELALFRDADGVEGQDRDYATLGLAAEWQGWNAALVHARRSTEPQGGGSVDDHLWQISAGYAFDFGLSVDLGWRVAREDEVNSRGLGLLLAYGYSF